MNDSEAIRQTPEPGSHNLMFRGDTITFTLVLPVAERGSAWLRTNIGHNEIRCREIIRNIRYDETPLGRDWFDIPLTREDAHRFQVTLPLCEVGHFEAKCFFLSDGQPGPIWPQGANTVINVEPADTCCANIIYNAFVRQFGPAKADGSQSSDDDTIRNLDGRGFTVIPPSGTFRDFIREIDFIIGELGCRFIQLLPIHPTPTTYARMGRFGSPYAALSFTAVDPALAEFDPKATPLEQFEELVDAVHERNARIILDLAVNHTGWAAGLHETHPQWLARDAEGRIEVPGAWGIVWEDLTRLDYTHTDLWQYMADVFLTWCRRGVDGFRCDAGYMIPVAAWKYILAVVREQYPGTIFFLEGLGGKLTTTRDILNVANFNWAYSELFQHYDRHQIERYLPEAMKISYGEGVMVHYCETHDNPRLAARSKTWAKMRTALCALFSHYGGFGFSNGVEWFAEEKIDVHGSPSLNWGASVNQVYHIRRLGILLKTHPAFQDQTRLELVSTNGGNCIAMLRHHIPTGKRLLAVVNLDEKTENIAEWNGRQFGKKRSFVWDLITEEPIPVEWEENMGKVLLAPGQALCLTADAADLACLEHSAPRAFALPERIICQRSKAAALEVWRFYHGISALRDFDVDRAGDELLTDPVAFCRNMNIGGDESRVVTWTWPRDLNRQVMVPPECFLLVRSDVSFCAAVTDQERVVYRDRSLPCRDGTFFVLFSPIESKPYHKEYTLKLTAYTSGRSRRETAHLVYLSRPQATVVNTMFHRSELLRHPFLMLGTNQRGGMMRIPASWGTLDSRYDAVLAANMHPDSPEDRWIMFARCRVWLVYQGYSQELSIDCLDAYGFDYGSAGYWRFHVPTGQGQHVRFLIKAGMVSGENEVRIQFYRFPSEEGGLPDAKKVQLILRPDIENRNFHEPTKAFTGPEQAWPDAFEFSRNGFLFIPDAEHCLEVGLSTGDFIPEPEWTYMVYRSGEAERGLDPHSDLFSPGYFSARLAGGQIAELTAEISRPKDARRRRNRPPATAAVFPDTPPDVQNMECALRYMLDHYVVNRQQGKTVIAGYPWFLDWGRDSLIFARGLIAAGRREDVRSIVKQFARFESNGTLPNMIRGRDASNRDTSDAPLWFIRVCAELVRAENDEAFLDEACGDRRIRDVVLSIAQSYLDGTPNGIRMDSESCLIYSPPHFTWMDTNYPAGTPREGYPIEIQALWYSALVFIANMQMRDDRNRREWGKTARHVHSSIRELFRLDEEGYLSDCIHAGTGQPARASGADDALRPNQLLAVTLGAVTDVDMCRKIVDACEELLVPGAVRSLADRPVRRRLPIVYHGELLNDPHYPYQGTYAGDEDTRRKPAYHNGTAWTWLFPSYCEAYVNAYGESAVQTAMALLAAGTRIINAGCTGHVPEILDGNYPHRQRGCDAQAWGASEFYRVWKMLVPD